MFTGLVQGLGRVARVTRRERGLVLEVSIPGTTGWDDLTAGESIAVNGVCLTAASIGGGSARFDVVPETVSRTVLADLAPGDRVNLERSLAAGDRFGGHYVLGHIDGVGTIRARREEGGEVRFRIDAGEWIRWIIPKGSIAVDGISLTVTEVEGSSFGVAIVPFTIEQTTLGFRRPGDRVHLECDHFGKWVFQAVRELAAGPPPRDLADALRRAGYLPAGGAEGEDGRWGE